VFPGPGNRFNIGVGLFPGGAAGTRLREFWEVFRRRFPPAATLIEASTPLSEFRGAPLRSGLQQEQFGRAGMLAAGEAMATSYSATGEGIGKAMESGMLAAVLISESLTGARPAAGLEEAYRDAFRTRFLPRYRAYHVAQRWARSPRILDLLARRAAAGRFVRAELEALIAERGDAGALFSVRGLLKALVR
jgi:flavin-dependent dehydrogenase